MDFKVILNLLIGCFFSFWLLRTGRRRWRLEIQAKRWPLVRGKVIGIVAKSETSSIDPYLKARRLYLEYEFSFAAKTVQSSMELDKVGDDYKLDEMRKKYPPGATINVRVNPEKPEESGLPTGLTWQTVVLLVFGILCSAGMVYCGWMMFGF